MITSGAKYPRVPNVVPCLSWLSALPRSASRVAGARIVEDVVGLDVRVRVAAAVKTIQCEQKLARDAPHARDGERTSHERLVETAAVFFKRHAHMPVVEKCLVQRDDFAGAAGLAANVMMHGDLENRRLAVAAALNLERDTFHSAQSAELFTNARRIS